MKEQTTGIKIAKRVLAWTLSAFMVVTMIPSLGFMAAGTGAKDPTGSTAKAYEPTASGQNAYADGKDWTATGQAGENYFKKIYPSYSKVTSFSAGSTISGVYFITANIEITAASGKSGLILGGDTTFVFLNNATLTVNGGAASGTTGAGAGIELGSGKTLTLDGKGTLKAKGGKAADGEAGEKGYNTSKTEGSTFASGNGGYGGYGGGGAGAGIGTKGGNGASRTGRAGAVLSPSQTASGYIENGNNGYNSTDSGTIKAYGAVTLNVTGGESGKAGKGGAGGSRPSHTYYGSGGGGGGGGGGASANHIGSGGPGGGSGGPGGAGYTRNGTTSYRGTGRGGSGGGPGGGAKSRGNESVDGRGGGGAGNTSYGSGGTYNNSGYQSSYYFLGSDGGAAVGKGGKGGKGGRSGYYGTSGLIYGTTLGSDAYNKYRRKIDINGYDSTSGTQCGGRSYTYWSYPVREINASILANSSAVLNADGSGSYKFNKNNAVQPTIKLVHAPTGATLTNNSAYTSSWEHSQDTPSATQPVDAVAKATTRGSGSNNTSYGQLVNNTWGNTDPIQTSQTLVISQQYTIDYPTYKINLDAAGGVGSDVINVKIGVGGGISPYQPYDGNPRTAPTREGYVFDGYYAEKEGKGKQYFSAIPADGYVKAQEVKANYYQTEANTTFYAKWIPQEYKIRFWSDYGEGSEYVEYNLPDAVHEKDDDNTSALVKPAVYGTLALPTANDLGIKRDHYDFVGWNIYEEQDWAMYKAGKTYKAGLSTKPNDVVNIYAAWRAKDQLAVSYDANGGSGAPPVDGTWADSDYTVSDQKPIREGYTFLGWNTVAAPSDDNPGREYQPGDVVSKDDAVRAITTPVTMYAQWQRNHSVTYRANGGQVTGGELKSLYPETGSQVDVDFDAEVTRTGYDFAGWRLKGTDTIYKADGVKQFDMPNNNVVLEAEWEPKKMEIVMIPENLWNLGGWRYADKDGNVADGYWSDPVAAAAFNEQTVDYDDPFEFSVVLDDKKVDATNMRLRINDINTEPVSVDKETTPGKTIYKYKIAKVHGGQMINVAGLKGKTYPVILDAGDGELRGNVSSHTFGEETPLPVDDDVIEDGSVETEGNTPVQRGYAFQGWFDSKSQEGEVGGNQVESIAATVIPQGDAEELTYYAKWGASKYNVKFDIGPLPSEEGSILQWKAGVTRDEYLAHSTDARFYSNVEYKSRVPLIDLSNYVKYEYLAAHEGEGEKAEADFLGWSLKPGASEPDFSASQMVSKLTENDGVDVTLYPVWGAPHYKLVLDPNGGELKEAVTGYQVGQSITLPDPERPGYIFDGWFTEKIADNTPQEEIPSTAQKVTAISSETLGDTVYYAKWTAGKYRYALQNMDPETGENVGATIISDEMTVDGEKATLPDDDTLPEGFAKPAGMELAGWSRTPYGPEEVEDDDGAVPAIIPGPLDFVGGSQTNKLWEPDEETGVHGLTLYPVWVSQGKKTLSYDPNGGEGGPALVSRDAGHNVSISFDVKPIRKGYQFVGWSRDSAAGPDDEGVYKSPEVLTLNTSIRLYAVWKAIPYTITYDANLGEGEEPAEDHVGFVHDDEYISTMTQQVGEFDEQVALEPSEPTRGDAYIFQGWSTVKNGNVEYQAGSIVSGFADETIDEDTDMTELNGKTLYAVWLVKDPAYLSFDANGGTGAPGMETHPVASTVQLPGSRKAPVYRGYTFKGWNTDPEATEAQSEVIMPENVRASKTLYAVWEKDKGMRLTYIHDDSTGSTPYDPTVYYKNNEADIHYMPAPSRTGYTFEGWDVQDTDIELRQANTEDAKLAITDELFEKASPYGSSSDIVQLFLKPAFKANEYTVKFDGNGATGEAPRDISKTYGTNAEMPGKDSLQGQKGFEFKGWNTAADGSGQTIAAGTESWDVSNSEGDNVTLYAIWEAEETPVVFDGGENSQGAEITFEKRFRYGDVLPDEGIDIPHRTGYDFKGYYLEECERDDQGNYIDKDGNVVDKSRALVKKVNYYDENMEPLRIWDKTMDDIAIQPGSSDKFMMKAEWEPQKYTISYHDESGSLVNSQIVTYGQPFRVADDADLEVPAGYRHIGWALDRNSEEVQSDLYKDQAVTPTKANRLYNPSPNGEAQTVSVYAIYQEIRKFNVNYDANGGTDAPQDNTKYEDGSTVSILFDPIPTRANYDFLGWTTYSNTSSVLPGGANEGKYYGDVTKGCKSFDGYDYHYGNEGPSETQKEMSFKIRSDTKLYAVWQQKTYYTVDFFGNPSSNGGEGNVTTKSNKFTGPDERKYTASDSQDGYSTDDIIYRSTSQYKPQGESPEITLPDGRDMFNNTDSDAMFMGWSKSTDAKVPEHKAGEKLKDITMDENVVFNAVWAHPVKNVKLLDIEKPEYEGNPSEDIEATSASGVNVTKVQWTPSADTFAAGTEYKLTVKMKASDGFYFKTDELPNVNLEVSKIVGGQTVKDNIAIANADKTLNAEGDILTVSYTFEATENIIVNGPKDEKKTEPVKVIGVTAPEAGKRLVTAGNAGDSRVDNGSWFPAVTWTAKDSEGNPKAAGVNAEPDTIYTATLKIKPAKGYAFDAAVTKATFSGDNVVVAVDNEEGSSTYGFLIVTYTFPATAKVDNDINLKLNGKLRNNQNLPDQTFTSADNVDKDSRMADITWFKGGSEVDVDKHKVTPNTKYVAQVVLKPASGYTFDTQTIVTFGGDQLEVKAKGTHPEGNDWAVLQSDGSVLVSHEFTSSGDVLLEIATAGTISADYGAAAAELELPGEVTITSEEGKRDADVAWIYGDELDKFKVVDGEGNVTEQSISDVLKSTDAEKRKGYTVKLQGAVTIPEGITVPDEMQPTVTTINVKIGEDPRLALEAEAEALEERAAEAIARAENIENPSDEVTRLVAALREKLDEMDQYKDNLEVSTPLGLEEKIMAAERALTDLQVEIAEIPTINILMLGDLTIGDPMPDRMYSTDVRIASTSHVPEITWAPNDKRVVEHQTYSARIRMEVAENGLVKEGGTVTFPDGKVLTIGAAAVDNELAELIHDHELGKDFLVVRRNYTSDKLILKSIADPEGLTVGWGTAPTNVKLPKTLEATTDHDKRDLSVEWIDGEGKVKVVKDDTVTVKDFAAVLSDKDNREEHQVVLETEVEVPERITNPDGTDPENPHVDTTKRITINIEADPRLVPESEAADLQSENGRATKALADAQAKMDSLSDETDPYYQRIKTKKEAVEQAITEMNNYIADLDNSTVNGIETEIEHVKALLTALENETDEIPVIEVKLGDDIVVNEKLPARAICTDDRIAEDSHVVNISWTPSSVKAEEGKEYYAMVTLTPKDPENIKLGGTVQFEDKKFTIQENDGSGEFAAYHNGKLIISKKFETSRSVLQSVSQPEERTVAWGSGTEALQLPSGIKVTTDVGERTVDVNWNLEGVNLSDITKRDGYDLEVKGTLSLPANMTNPDEISTEVKVTVHVEADPNNAEIRLHVYGLKDKNDYRLSYGVAFPDEINVTAGSVSVFSDDHRQETDWQTNDKKVKAGTVYQIVTTIRPSQGAEFVEGRPITFDGVELNVESGNPENGKLEYAKKNEDGSLEVSRTYRSENAQLESADKVEDVAIAWNTEKTADAIGLPKTLGITTDDGRATAPSIEWDMDSMDYSASDINKRKAHTVTVKGKLAMPVDVNGEPAVDVPEEGMDIVTATVNVAADPRLEKEAAAAKLDSDAKKLIEEAKKLGVGAGEITRLQNELKAMNDEVSPNNLDKSTADSDQKKIDAVNTALKALQKVVDDKKAADKKAEEEKAANTVNEKKGIQPGANMKAVEKFLLNRKSDTDPAGSTVAPLKVKGAKQTKKSIKVRWSKAPGAAKYVLYGNECGKAKKLKKIKLLKGKTFNVKKIGGKKLKKGKYHKFIVIAYNAQNKVVAVSKYIHVATKGGKVGNHKRVDVKIKKGKKWKKIRKATVKAGKKLRLKGIAVKAGGKKIKVKKHRKVIFESSNPKVAKVTKNGMVKGVKKGKAKIHAYAQNGVLRTITVTVK